LFWVCRIGEAFAIRFADKLVYPLHNALPLLETLNFIDQLFGSIRVIAKNDHVRFGGGRSPAEILGFIMMFLRLPPLLYFLAKIGTQQPDPKQVPLACLGLRQYNEAHVSYEDRRHVLLAKVQ
jgi:hypothetical protein